MQNSPLCIGIIMDGNRRWAKEQGLPVFAGHKAGFETLKKVLRWSKQSGIQHLVVYAFSTENMKRGEKETAHIFKLFLQGLTEFRTDKENEALALHILGSVAELPHEVVSAITEVEKNNAPSATHHLWVCFNYGGRTELVAGVQSLCASGVSVDEHSLKEVLWSAKMPDPDLILRTGGEHRLSGFLTWASVYSELFFSDTLWPAFSKEEFLAVLETYAQKERRFGK